MKKLLFLVSIVFCSTISFSQQKRDLLLTRYSLESLAGSLAAGDSWVTYPAYQDRESWISFPEELRNNYIKLGEKFFDYHWPSVRATEYLAFTRTGDRMVMERPQGERMEALQSLVMAELMEGKGRFMDDIVNGVFSFCEQSYWGLSACFYMYNDREKTNLPDIENPIIDLWVGEVSCDLAWVWYFFHEEFDKISPVLSRRLKYELTSRVLEPFYERNDYWWITGSGRGAVNNWTPWCNYNVLTCILLMEDDTDKRINGIYKTMRSVDLFFNVYPDDGGCDEGPTYWGLAGGKAFEYLKLLSVATDGKVTLFDHPLIGEIGKYVYRAHIAEGEYYINFADSPPKGHPRAGVIYQYGKEIIDPIMMHFGAFLLDRMDFGSKPEISTLGPVLENLYSLADWKNTIPEEPLIADYYFPDLQVALARDRAGSTEGFFLAAKGGHNNEQHNHNDVGSCIIFYNGLPVIVDVGVETYTKDTFSDKRYTIWTMQSDYHNLPLINGISQKNGRNFKARDLSYKATYSRVNFSLDIAGAYPEEAHVERWLRKYTLERKKKIQITDDFRLIESTGVTELHYMTPLRCELTTPGEIILSSGSLNLGMSYPEGLMKPRVETKEITDPKLIAMWGDRISMIVFEVIKIPEGNLSIEIIPKK